MRNGRVRGQIEGEDGGGGREGEAQAGYKAKNDVCMREKWANGESDGRSLAHPPHKLRPTISRENHRAEMRDPCAPSPSFFGSLLPAPLRSKRPPALLLPDRPTAAHRRPYHPVMSESGRHCE